MRDLHIRITQELFDSVTALATRRGEPVTVVLRRIISQGVSENAAYDSQAFISRIIRPVIRSELTPWKHWGSRSALDAAISGQLITWLLREYLASHGRNAELPRIIAEARQRGLERIKRPLQDWEEALSDDNRDQHPAG